jgi:hypothetical protein
MAKKDNKQVAFRQCFLTPDGRRCLTFILIEAGYFDTDIKGYDELAVLNFAKKILANIGIFKLKTAESFVNQILDLPVGD